MSLQEYIEKQRQLEQEQNPPVQQMPNVAPQIVPQIPRPQAQPIQVPQPQIPQAQPASLQNYIEQQRQLQPEPLEQNNDVSVLQGLGNMAKSVGRGIAGVPQGLWEFGKHIVTDTAATVKNIWQEPSLLPATVPAVGKGMVDGLIHDILQGVVDIPEAIAASYKGREFERQLEVPTFVGLVNQAADSLYKNNHWNEKQYQGYLAAQQRNEEIINKLPIFQTAGQFALPIGAVGNAAKVGGVKNAVLHGTAFGAVMPGSLEDKVTTGGVGAAIGAGIGLGNKAISRGYPKIAENAPKAMEAAKEVSAKIVGYGKDLVKSDTAFDNIRTIREGRSPDAANTQTPHATTTENVRDFPVKETPVEVIEQPPKTEKVPVQPETQNQPEIPDVAQTILRRPENRGSHPVHFENGSIVKDIYDGNVYKILENDKRGMAKLENVETGEISSINAHNNARYIQHQIKIEDVAPNIAKKQAERGELIEKARDLGLKGNLKNMKVETLKASIEKAETTVNMKKHIWEGWTVESFVEALEPQLDMIMSGNAINKPFKNRQELKKWVMDNQPYYKKYIPDVVNHFAQKYNVPNDFKPIEKVPEIGNNKNNEVKNDNTRQKTISEPKPDKGNQPEMVGKDVTDIRGKERIDSGRSSTSSGNGVTDGQLLSGHRELIEKKYKNQVELNKAIEDFVAQKHHQKYSVLPDEVKAWLKKYSGAGGLEKQGAEGKGLLSEYYTPDNVVKKMWELTAQYIETDGSKILEPSVGIGRFLEHAPEGTKFDGFEINPHSAEITKILYPDANIKTGEFQAHFIDPAKNIPLKNVKAEYDVVIGNPPYGKNTGRYYGMGEGKGISRLETYFIKRGLDCLKENGVLSFIVPSSFLDGVMTPAKLKIAGNAEILDAYRLPVGTFDTTGIGTDIIVLRKTKNINSKDIFNKGEWFKQNPEKILGEIETKKDQWGKEQQIVKGNRDIVDTIDTSKIQKAVTKNIGESEVKKTIAKPIQNKTIEPKSKKVEQAKVDYDVYVPENKISDHDYQLFSDTSVDGTLPHNKYTPNEKINQLDGKLYNDFNYLQGDIYEKLDRLERENINPEQKERQRKKLEAVKPKPKELHEIEFTPTSDFIKDMKLSNKEKNIKSSVFEAYLDFIDNATPSERNYVNLWDLRNYVEGSKLTISAYGNSDAARKVSKVQQLTKIKKTADSLFNDFIQTHLSKSEREQLRDNWNRTYNAIHNPDYNKVPLMIKDMKSTFYGKPLKIFQVQKEGVNFLTNRGVGLLGFEVGVGKTLSGIVATVQNMQMGRAKRPLVIVPKQVKSNWLREFKELFPNLKVNDLDNLSKFKGSVEDGTVSVATFEALSNIWYDEIVQKIDGETFRSGEITDLIDKLYEVASDQRRQSTKRGYEQLKADVEKIIGIAEKGNKKTHKINDLGFDHLTVDEAHGFRNLFRSAKAYGRDNNAYTSIGQSGDPSARAARLFLLTQHLMSKNNNRNVFMLTATPFNNSPLEIFNMLSFIGKDKLDAMGLNNVYQFMENYADLEADWVVKNNNDVDFTQIIKGFKNASSLRELIKSLMMIRSADDAGVIRPKKHTDRITLEPSEEQLRLIEKFEEEALASDDDGAILKKINQARQVTLSPDIASKNYDVTPEAFIKNSPKLEYIAKAIEEMKKKDPKTSQLIYMPLGLEFIPKIKQYFVDKKVFKPDEIEIISSNTPDEKIPAITDSFNDINGQVKLIIGTQRIKEGMNLNKNSSILYIPFIDWNPTDYIQIVGRVWRQGNRYDNVKVVVPLLKNSSDPFMFQKLDEKTSRINNIMDESKEYIDTGELNTAEEKINMITIPEKRAKMFVNVEKQKLSTQKEQMTGRLEMINHYAKKLDEYKESLADGKANIESFERLSEETKSAKYWLRETYEAAYKKAQEQLTRTEKRITRLEIDFNGKDKPENLRAEIEKIIEAEKNIEIKEKEKLVEYQKIYDENEANKRTIDDHIKDFKKNINEIYGQSDSNSYNALPLEAEQPKRYQQTREKAFELPKINLNTKSQTKAKETRKTKIRAARDIQSAREYRAELKEGIRTWKADIQKRRYDVDRCLNEFVNTSKKIAKELNINDKQLREIMPFLRERTALPEGLERPDLQELWKKLDSKTKNELTNMADFVSDKFERYWEEYQAVQADKTFEPLKDEIENYITHLWEFKDKKQEALLTNYFATKSRFAKKRTIESLFDGINGIEAENGEIIKFQPKVLDYAELLKIQSDNLIKATIDKVLVDAVKKFKTKDGINLLLPASQAPSHWVTIDNHALNKSIPRAIDTKYGETVSPEMQNILADMGIVIGRRISNYTRTGKPNSLGKYVKNEPPEIRLRRWFSNEVLAHEVGHALDEALSLNKNGFVERHIDELNKLNEEKINKFTKLGKKKYINSNEEMLANYAAVFFNDTGVAYDIAPSATKEFIKEISENPKFEKLLPGNFDWENAKNVIEEKTLEWQSIKVKAHPDIADVLKTAFDSPREYLECLYIKPGKVWDKMNSVAKMFEFSLSLFHGFALTESYYGNVGAKKATPEALNFKKIFAAVKNNDYDIYKEPELVRRAIDDGLELGSTLDFQRRAAEKIVHNTAKFLEKAPFIGKILSLPAKAIDKTMEINNKALWDVIHNNYKIKSYQFLVENEIQNNKSISVDKRREIAQWVNDSYGGQIYENLGITSNLGHTLSKGMMSPDWFISTTRQFFASFSTETGHKVLNNLAAKSEFWDKVKDVSHALGTTSITDNVKASGLRGDVARKFWVRALGYSLLYMNILNAANRAYDQKENPNLYPKEMTAREYSMLGNSLGNKTYVFVGRNKDGTERYVRLGKQFREIPEFIEDPIKKAGSKIAPMPQWVVKSATGRSFSGYEDRKLAESEGWGRVGQSALSLGKTFLPFSVGSLINKGSDYSIYDTFASTGKGMTYFKGKKEYKKAIVDGDAERLEIITRDLIRNKIDPKKVFNAAKFEIAREYKYKYKDKLNK